MSYIAIFLLLQAPPIKAFRIFSNLIMDSDFYFKVFSFDKKQITNIQKTCCQLVKDIYPAVFKYFRNNKIDIWEIAIIEVSLIFEIIFF